MPKSKIQQDIEKSGVYFTHLVKELIEVLVKSNRPVSIDELMKIFEKRKFHPYQSSIYRQLKRLSDLGFVEESIFSDGAKRYCYIYERDHHHHFECKKCGDITSVPMKSCSKKMNGILQELNKKGLKITSHSLTFGGLCPKCN